MARSANIYTGDGITTNFAVNFVLGFISRDDVFAYVEDELDGGQNQIFRTITWINDGLITLSPAPADGKQVFIRRIQPKEILQHDFQDGALLNEASLDEANLQSLYIMHEILDGFYNVDELSPEDTALTIRADLEMNGYYIQNVASPTQDGHVVTRLWAETSGTSILAQTIAAKDAAELAETHAETAETNAETAETNAGASASAASTSETNAASSAAAALVSENAAQSSEDDAAISETNADASAAAASTSETNAAASEAAAAVSETNAAASEAAALVSKNNAETAETGAENAQSYAEEWANKTEDVLVSAAAGGDQVDDYSAMHWAQKAADSAETAGNTVTFEALDLNGDVGTSADQVAEGNHDHSGVYQSYDADIPTVVASQAEMEAGTSTANRTVTPLRVKQAILALAPEGGSPGLVIYTSSGTYTPPAGIVGLEITAIGGGGAGGGAYAGGAGKASLGGGGAGGGCAIKHTTTIDSSYAVVIGAGGLGVTTSNGGNGGDTTVISTTVSLNGKGGGGGSYMTGTSGNQKALGGNAAIAFGGTINLSGGQGFDSTVVAGEYASPGHSGASVWGGGRRVVLPGHGTAAITTGEGGSGAAGLDSTSSYKGGNGYAGMVLIKEYYG
jgi:hypothetical protein